MICTNPMKIVLYTMAAVFHPCYLENYTDYFIGNKLQYVASVGSGYQHKKGAKVLLTT